MKPANASITYTDNHLGVKTHHVSSGRLISMLYTLYFFQDLLPFHVLNVPVYALVFYL